MSLRVALGALALLMLAIRPSAAQPTSPSAAPPVIAFAEGTVWLEHATRTEPAAPNQPLLAGDRLRTDAGRLEIVFPDGSTLHLDHFTTVDVLSNILVRLWDGQILLTAADVGSAGAPPYRIDAPAGSVHIVTPGEYRASTRPRVGGADLELVVTHGEADLANDLGVVAVAAGQRAILREGEPPGRPRPANSAMWDAFSAWVAERRDVRIGYTSRHHLPSNLYPHGGVLDRHGSWRRHAVHGYVWYPSARSAWRPYSHGRWTVAGTLGLVWMGSDPWAWPTHHYGRWGLAKNGLWFWIPGSRWAPAWVHWATGPGVVAWCPLGFDGRPVVDLRVVTHARAGRRHQSARAWSIVPQRSFGLGLPVGRRVIGVHRLARQTRAGLVAGGTRPAGADTKSATRRIARPRDARSGSLGHVGVAPPSRHRPTARALATTIRTRTPLSPGLAARVPVGATTHPKVQGAPAPSVPARVVGVRSRSATSDPGQRTPSNRARPAPGRTVGLRAPGAKAAGPETPGRRPTLDRPAASPKRRTQTPARPPTVRSPGAGAPAGRIETRRPSGSNQGSRKTTRPARRRSPS